VGAVHKTVEHRQAREAWAPTVAAGQAECAEIRCLMGERLIVPGTPWDMAHDRVNGGYLGPAHRGCNRSEGATFGNRLRGLIRHGGGQLPPAGPQAPTVPWSSRVW
jgi:hypothetical protein